ncbi:MAG TPA: hypothetical protein VK790_01435 [Solirubrobacteraceae bacterium]|nr:hypothetical protein [Solirubrobacteraceae bacterium]
MSVTAPPPTDATEAAPASVSPQTRSGDTCPLCGASLHPDQEWCLRCGAAARTRLAASPRWKGLTATLATVIALSLGVLAAALVSLASGSASAPATTRTVTTAAAALTPTTTAASTAPATAAPGGAAANTGTPATSAPTSGTTASTAPAATTTTPATGQTGTTTASTPTSTSQKLTPQGRRELAKKVKEDLKKIGFGRVTPSTGTN